MADAITSNDFIKMVIDSGKLQIVNAIQHYDFPQASAPASVTKTLATVTDDVIVMVSNGRVAPGNGGSGQSLDMRMIAPGIDNNLTSNTTSIPLVFIHHNIRRDITLTVRQYTNANVAQAGTVSISLLIFHGTYEI